MDEGKWIAILFRLISVTPIGRWFTDLLAFFSVCLKVLPTFYRS